MATTPKFLGADLLGDSMLLRFSLRHADYIPKFHGHPNSWGMCRSGKAAGELLVEEWLRATINKRAVIMIGTNDLLRVCPGVVGLTKYRKSIRHTLKKIKDKATRKYKHVYFCTVPEIPRLEEDHKEATRERYHRMLATANKDIMTFGERHESVTSVDLRGKFSRDCFERLMGNGGSRRKDDIHLNERGLVILRRILKDKLSSE